MKITRAFLVLLVVLGISCSDKDDDPAVVTPVEKNFNFSSNLEEWEADYADYPVGEESFYELEFNHSTLPAPLDQNEHAIRQSGNNHSDDLFMFIKRKITGLQPNHRYEVTFSVEFATNAADNSFGVGGSPASSVYIKAGASQNEPKKEADAGYYRMNIATGDQSNAGDDMLVLGDFSNGLEENIYALKTLTNEDPFMVSTNQQGEVWVILAVDSGFEATTTIYYNSISVRFQ